MIFSLLTTALVIVMALVSVIVLWDSGLRWSSALSQLRRQLKEIDEPAMQLRPRASARFGGAASVYSFAKHAKPRVAA